MKGAKTKKKGVILQHWAADMFCWIKKKELAFENEEGSVWKVIKPMFSTAPCLNHTHVYIKNRQCCKTKCEL